MKNSNISQTFYCKVNIDTVEKQRKFSSLLSDDTDFMYDESDSNTSNEKSLKTGDNVLRKTTPKYTPRSRHSRKNWNKFIKSINGNRKGKGKGIPIIT